MGESGASQAHRASQRKISTYHAQQNKLYEGKDNKDARGLKLRLLSKSVRGSL